jgi:MerR family redox-sensitive transcriptional activator SoxR
MLSLLGGSYDSVMLSISQVAREMNLNPSAIRYYEQIGILPRAQRVNGQRRYDASVLHRLAVVQRARETGFTLDEIRELFFGFKEHTTASKRWTCLSRKKLAELETQARQIASMQQVLRRMTDCCHCETLEQCGKGILARRQLRPGTRLRVM